jgi:hypothetical protein
VRFFADRLSDLLAEGQHSFRKNRPNSTDRVFQETDRRKYSGDLALRGSEPKDGLIRRVKAIFAVSESWFWQSTLLWKGSELSRFPYFQAFKVKWKASIYLQCPVICRHETYFLLIHIPKSSDTLPKGLRAVPKTSFYCLNHQGKEVFTLILSPQRISSENHV